MFLLRNLFVSQPKSIYTSQHIVRQLSHITRLNEQLNGTYTPRRACLYVPGNDEKKLKKIETLDSDCVILDCEDGVAINKKDEARNTIKKMIDQLSFKRTEPIVRVNSLSSNLAEEDLKVTLSASKLPPTVMLPKVEEPAELSAFAEMLYDALKSRGDATEAKLKLIIFIESATGLLRFQDICQKANCLTNEGAPFVLDGVVFGSDDFCADIGATRTTDARELLYARQQIVVVAKAYRIQAIDLVHIDFKDTEGLRQQSVEGAAMGFTGKQCIHPLQVPVVQEAFTPSLAKIEWAQELITCFNDHQKSGKGAFTFRGNMIDMPLLLQAKNIVQLAEMLNINLKTRQMNS